MLRSNRKQGFFVFARAPGWGGLAMDVDVRREHGYSWKVECVICISEKDFDISVLDLYHS
jgi:hypothetical protein